MCKTCSYGGALRGIALERILCAPVRNSDSGKKMTERVIKTDLQALSGFEPSVVTVRRRLSVRREAARGPDDGDNASVNASCGASHSTVCSDLSAELAAVLPL